MGVIHGMPWPWHRPVLLGHCFRLVGRLEAEKHVRWWYVGFARANLITYVADQCRCYQILNIVKAYSFQDPYGRVRTSEATRGCHSPWTAVAPLHASLCFLCVSVRVSLSLCLCLYIYIYISIYLYHYLPSITRYI